MRNRRAAVSIFAALCLGVSLMSVGCGNGPNGTGGTITVISPVAGTKLLVGDTITVSWNGDLANPTFQCHYNIAGTSWMDLVMVQKLSSTSAKVQLPNTVRHSNNFQIRVSDGDNAKEPGVSGECLLKHILITSPNGGEVYTMGQTVNIAWRASEHMGPVNLQVTADEGMSYVQIFKEAVDMRLGNFSWRIGTELEPAGFPSTTCRVRLEQYTDKNIYDESAGNFTVN